MFVTAESAALRGRTSWFPQGFVDELFPVGFFARRPEQWRAARDGAREPFKKRRIAFDPIEELRQRLGIADWKIAGIIASEQTDRAVDARGEHGNTGRDRFGDDVCSAFAQR